MTKLQVKDYEFNLVKENPFISLYYNKKLKMAICSAKEEYIPIDYFKEMFLHISAMLKEFEINHLVFDKQKLRTFHQPSMEWYFAVWKPVVKNMGLTNHYKILPKLDWFEKAVEAGKFEIFHKFSREILSGITITYVNSTDQAIDDIVQKNKFFE
ncbi:MAG: hypothetical protein H7331_07595 [Bacteroidia bacterium]|nr:hypothetical protein [Bacteroidia bacterium]